MTIHSVRQTYDPTRPCGPWLVAIANRRAFDRLRRQRRRQIHEVPLTNAHDGSVSEADRHECRTDIDWLNEAIGDMPPVQRQAIRLLKLEEMSLQEAASSTGTSIASLKVARRRIYLYASRMVPIPADSIRHSRVNRSNYARLQRVRNRP